MSAVRKLLSIADGDNPLAEELALFIVQLVFILVVARVLGYLFRFIKQPQVVAEVITGIILGPSVLGNIPTYMDNLFPKDSLAVISVFANIGLIFFMFLIGVELDPALLKNNAKSAMIIAFASMAAPFGIGALVSILLYHMYLTAAVKFSTFLLFVGVAMSITAFPVLARILTEQRMTSGKVGMIALSAAAVNDVVAWILLAVVVSIARAKSPLSTLWTLLIMIGFFLLMAFIVRPLLIRLNNAADKSASTKHQMVIVVFLLVLASAWLTEVIGIHAIFGGFVMGVICPRDKGFALFITERIEDIIIILLLPLYFTYSGLRTNLGDLNTAKSWGICILVIVLACVGKIVGSMSAAKFLGNTWRESLTVGVLMNTKGLVELIVLNLGLDVGVLTEELFGIFVMMALITTMFTSPLLHVIWIRNQRKKAAPLVHDAFSVMMCVSNQESGLAMVSIAGTLAVQRGKKFSMQALHITEVTDSFSSYFFAHKKQLPQFMEIIKERTRALMLPLKIKQMFAVNVEDDIDYYCRSSNFDLILLAWNEPLIVTGGSKIKQIIAHTSSTVGVVINKGVHETVSINKVLVLYTGEPHQKDALKLARMMSRKKGTQVTLMSSVPTEQLNFSELEFLNVIQCENPLIAGIEESKQKYDLVVVGIAREWSSHDDTILQTSDLLLSSPVSVLLVHPKMDGLAKKKRKISLSEEKARLFLGDSRLIALRKEKESSSKTSDIESGESIPLDSMHEKYPTSSDGNQLGRDSSSEEDEPRQLKSSSRKVSGTTTPLKGSKSHDTLYFSLEEENEPKPTASRSNSVHGLSSYTSPRLDNIEVAIEIVGENIHAESSDNNNNKNNARESENNEDDLR